MNEIQAELNGEIASDSIEDGAETTKSSGIDAFSLAMKNSHDVSWLSCILLLLRRE